MIDNVDSVNIREYPTIHSRLIDKLPTNFQINFLDVTETFENIAGASGMWIKVSYVDKSGKTITGFVYDFYTQFETDWITVKFTNYYREDYCIIEFNYDGITIPILNEYCLSVTVILVSIIYRLFLAQLSKISAIQCPSSLQSPRVAKPSKDIWAMPPPKPPSMPATGMWWYCKTRAKSRPLPKSMPKAALIWSKVPPSSVGASASKAPMPAFSFMKPGRATPTTGPTTNRGAKVLVPTTCRPACANGTAWSPKPITPPSCPWAMPGNIMPPRPIPLACTPAIIHTRHLRGVIWRGWFFMPKSTA